MSNSSTKKTYTVIISGKTHLLKRRTPMRLSNDKTDVAHNIRAYVIPLTPIHFQVSEDNLEKYAYEKQFFDEHKLVFPNDMSLLTFKQKAKSTFKDLKTNEAYNNLSLQLFNKPYPDLIHEIKLNHIKKFDRAFGEIGYDIYLSHKYPDISYPLICSPDNLKTFEELALQGHIYSQLIAGIILACEGKFDKGIQYLIDAYNNRFTIALSFITEFLILKEDWVGAFQCALLAYDIDPGYGFLVDKIIACTTHVMIDTNQIGDGIIPATLFGPGYMPLLHFILHHVLTEDFQKLAKKYRPDWLPTPEEQEEEMRHFFSKWRSPKVNQTKSY